MNLNKRVNDLEQAVNPAPDLPWIAVYHQEGERWITRHSQAIVDGRNPTGSIDYRDCIGGPDKIPITEDQFRDLESRFNIIIVTYTKKGIDYGNPEQAD